MLNIKIFGIVQGVGFRPFVSHLANANKIVGTVANKGSYVEIFACGDEMSLKKFLNDLQTKNPPRSTILKLDTTELPDKKFTDFKIIESVREEGDIFVSPDIATCEACVHELFDPADRRYLHPFINCTACGPRLTILQNMPYDRERTSMSEFPMCNVCTTEYFDENSRRFDAQPICCNDCGPEIYMLGKNLRGHEAIRHTRKILSSGGIVAIKGIGGFHLACDAENFLAVERLRKSKMRPTKPFAVMFRNISAVEHSCTISELERKILDSPQKPIILLEKIEGELAENIAPNINKIGAMLPYTPLHMLLFDFPDDIRDFPEALVMTSGNPSGVPITIDDDSAIENFDYCDAILSHNRKILLRADDSVMDFVEEHPLMIRRSRGYAPLPIFVDRMRKKSALGIGGELKNTFCLAKGNLLYSSPYIGDASDLRTIEILENSIERMMDLLEIIPEIIACDLHPRYQTTIFAERFAEKFQIPLKKIQHHYAHILSCMAENNFHDSVIGVAFDGTGYGTDRKIWGGEFFICDPTNFERVDHIKSFKQAGGDKAAREGWRIALSMTNLKIAHELNFADEKNLRGQQFLLDKNINCVESTSVGRLFDAIAAILGVCNISTYEGEAAMRLQAVAEHSTKSFCERFLSSDEIVQDIVERRLNDENIYDLAKLFHEDLAEYTARTVEKLSFETNIKTVALSGGVFHNSLLNSLVTKKLRRCGFNVIRNSMIPANDGGICIGQAFHLLKR